MKISDLLEISEICKDHQVQFIPMKPGTMDRNEVAIYGKQDGIHYFITDTCFGVSACDNCVDLKRKLQFQNEKWFYNIQEVAAVYDRYLALAEILLSIDEHYKINAIKVDSIYNQENIRKYADKIEKCICDSLKFDDISEMSHLKDMVLRNKLYRELVFNVSIWECNESEQYKLRNRSVGIHSEILNMPKMLIELV